MIHHAKELLHVRHAHRRLRAHLQPHDLRVHVWSRIEGPRRTLAKARARLAGYAPAALGIEVGRLLEQVAAWEGWLAEKEGEAPAVPRLATNQGP